MKTFKLGLYGKEYNDINLVVNKCILHDTNKVKKRYNTKGGIYNFEKCNNIEKIFFKDGIKNAYIISEEKISKRTSFTFDISSNSTFNLDYKKIDWLHIAYIDDLNNLNKINFLKKPISIDFCTLDDREKYLKFIKQSKLVFDSRERKFLYKNLKFDTPLILHDEFGCECIINDKVVYQEKITPLKKINVNGAGDIFAGLFIDLYLNSGIKIATKNCSSLTKNIIKNAKEI